MDKTRMRNVVFAVAILLFLLVSSFAVPTIAYGNLYGVAGGYLYCIGGSPKDWAMGMIGNVEQPRVAVGQQGPTDISTPKWYFQTGADVFSNPAI